MSYEEHRWHPDEAEAISSYYAVYKETINSDGIFAGASFNAANISTEDKMASIKREFISVLNRLIAYEKSKESRLIYAFLDKYGIDKEFRSLLEGCLKSGDYTKAFNYIHIKQHNIKEGIKQLPYDLEKWNEYMDSYLNLFIEKTAEKAIQSIDNIENMSPHTVAQQMLKFLSDNYEGEAKYKDNFENFMTTFGQELMPLLKDNNTFGKANWDIPMNEIKIGKEKFNSSQSIKDTYISKIVQGLVRGLSQEEIIVSFYGGASTARASRELNFFSGRKQTVQTETDAYLILDLELEPNKQANDTIKKLQSDAVIRDFLDSDPQKNFIIHYSSKDSSIALSTSNGNATRIGKIKGSGSLDSRIPTLQELGSAEGFSPDSINKLIFTIINNGAGLVNEGQGLDEIIKAITNLIIGFMFEDFHIQIQNVSVGAGNGATPLNETHLYFLSGKFVPISTILEEFIKQIENELSNDVVRVGIKPSGTLYTSNQEYGRDRWDFVRSKTISQTNMDIYILNSLLKNLGF